MASQELEIVNANGPIEDIVGADRAADLCLIAKIERGLRQADRGWTLRHEDVKERILKRLKRI